MKKIFNDDGFTLVELMVVVAIIGILSAVAIPNFKQYQAKSKTSEAKLHLASVYSAQTAFMSDWDNYATCLNDMGYNVAARGYYVIGFSSVSLADGHANTNAGSTVCNANSFQLSPAIGNPGAPGGADAGILISAGGVTSTFSDLSAYSVEDDGSTFIAGAAGKISADNADRNIWSINEDKSLIQVTKGY